MRITETAPIAHHDSIDITVRLYGIFLIQFAERCIGLLKKPRAMGSMPDASFLQTHLWDRGSSEMGKNLAGGRHHRPIRQRRQCRVIPTTWNHCNSARL